MARIIFRSPNYKSGKAITIKGFKLDSKMLCDMCGTELSKLEADNSSVFTVIEKVTDKEAEQGIMDKRTYNVRHLCFDCIEKLTGRRPDNERSS